MLLLNFASFVFPENKEMDIFSLIFAKVYSIPSPYLGERRIPVNVKYVSLWPERNIKKSKKYIYIYTYM